MKTFRFQYRLPDDGTAAVVKTVTADRIAFVTMGSCGMVVAYTGFTPESAAVVLAVASRFVEVVEQVTAPAPPPPPAH